MSAFSNLKTEGKGRGINMNEVLKGLLEELDLDELKELKGFDGRYLVDLRNGRVFDVVADSYKKNTVNSNGYIYHRLVRKDGLDEVVGLHRIVLRAALEVDYDIWRKWNLVCDHRNDLRYDSRFENLQLLTQSENLKKRKALKSKKRFTSEELEQLNQDFELLEAEHGEFYNAYKKLSKKYKCAPLTIQLRYLEYKRAN